MSRKSRVTVVRVSSTLPDGVKLVALVEEKIVGTLELPFASMELDDPERLRARAERSLIASARYRVTELGCAALVDGGAGQVA